MSSSTTNLAWGVPKSASSVDHLHKQSIPVLTAGPQQVLIRLTAVALNYRDLLVATRSPVYPGVDGLPGNHIPDIVPCCDGSGIIHGVGSSSTWAGREGTRVVLHPNEWLSGDIRNLELGKVLGATNTNGR